MADITGQRRRDSRLLLLLVALTAYSVLLLAAKTSADLMASWLAGHFHAIGAMDQIYPPDTDIFTMHPPSDWGPLLAARGYEGAVFPFIYPPFWVVLLSWITPFTTPEGMIWLASLLNPALMFGMVMLALRLTNLPAEQRFLAAVTALIVLFFSVGGTIALIQNQPQILVSFLIVLAIERDRANRPLAAGTALAFAAALKLYPILFIALWAAAGRWRSVRWALVVGGGLGLASLLLAGWPLHASFLQQTLLISRTAMMTPLNYGLDSLIGNLAFGSSAIPIEQYTIGSTNGVDIGWQILPKPLWWRLASVGLLLATVALPAWRIAQGKGDDRFLWPMTIAAIAFFSPLSWAYYYLPLLAFTPLLFEKIPPRRLLLALSPLLVTYLVTLIHSIGSLSDNPLIHGLFLTLMTNPYAGVITMAWLFALFVYAARKT